MIRLGIYLSLRGTKEGKVRLILTTLGVALAVTLLLFTLGGFNGLKARDAHGAWLITGSENIRPSVDESSSDPLWWRLSSDMFDGEEITIVEVASTGADSPLLPGLDRQPQPGEFFVSPALEKLLAGTPEDLLGARFPGTLAGVLGDAALKSPVSLVAVVGRSPAEMEASGVATQVRSIETAPVEHDYTEFMRVVLGIGAIGLMLPVLVFVITSTRLAAARREERLAALRLVGATPGQVNLIAGVEAALAAVAGTILGFGFFFAFRPLVAGIPFTGEPFFTSDVGLDWWAAAGVAAGVPAAAVAASMFTLRRVHISPLGVTRKAPARRPSALRLLAPVVALGLLFAVGLIDDSSLGVFAVLVIFAAIAIGVMIAGPWLTYMGGRILAAVARRDSTLIAARRLGSDSRRAFRAISGLVLAVFIGTVFVAVVETALSQDDGSWRNDLLPDSTIIQSLQSLPDGYMPAGAGESLLAEAQAMDGVEAVVPVLAWTRPGVGVEGLVTDEQWLLCGGSSEWLNGSGYVSVAVDNLTGGYLQSTDPTEPISTVEAAQAVAADEIIYLLVLNDGRWDTIERVRTSLEVASPDALRPYTVAEITDQENAIIDVLSRMVDVGVVLCLVIAGCSLAVSIAGGLVERRRAFALLRLAGMPVRRLYRAVLLEAAVPLVLAAVASAGVGFIVAGLILRNSSDMGFILAAPGASYYGLLIGGLLAALGLVAATLPLAGRMTDPGSVRME